MLNFIQVCSCNLDKLPTNSVNWVPAILLDLYQLSTCKFGQLWFNLGNFGTFLLDSDHLA